MNVDETNRLAALFRSHNTLSAHNSAPLQSGEAQSWSNTLKLWVPGAPGVAIMKSCPGLEQADYRDNEGLGCCRVIAAPLQDSAFFSLLPQTPGTRSHFSIRHCSSQQEPKLAKRAHFTTCMCDLANLLLCVCVCVRGGGQGYNGRFSLSVCSSRAQRNELR